MQNRRGRRRFPAVELEGGGGRGFHFQSSQHFSFASNYRAGFTQTKRKKDKSPAPREINYWSNS